MATVEELQHEVDELKKQLSERDAEIERLSKRVEELERSKQNTTESSSSLKQRKSVFEAFGNTSTSSTSSTNLAAKPIAKESPRESPKEERKEEKESPKEEKESPKEVKPEPIAVNAENPHDSPKVETNASESKSLKDRVQTNTENSSSSSSETSPSSEQKKAAFSERRVSTWSASKFKAESNKCITCGKTVYATEKIVADDKVFHKQCLRCSHCNCQLKLGNYASLSGQLFCKPHFKQLFKTKGNYSEGFGKLKPQQEHDLKAGKIQATETSNH